MDFQEIRQAAVDAAKELQIQDYELYYQCDGSDDLQTFDGEIEKFSSSVTQGFCFKCVVDGKMGYAATELFTAGEARAIVKKALQSAQICESDDMVFVHQKGDSYAEIENHPDTGVLTPQYIDFALKAEKLCFEKDSRVVKGTQCSVSEMSKTVTLFNSNGLELSHTNKSVGAVLEVVAEDKGEKFTAYHYDIAERFEQLDMEKLVHKTVEKAVSQIGGSSVPSGEYRIVMDNLQMAAMLSIFDSVFSSENAQKGLSLLKGKEGEIIASEAVTVVDDPLYKTSPVRSPFDAEGVATYAKNVIENGRLNTLLYNLKTAYKEGKKTTGNAYKDSYSSNVSVSPFTFYLKPSELPVSELYKTVENGILITQMKGAHAGANSVTGDFSLESKGFLIENGRVTRPVEGITIAGNFFTMLRDIEAVADNLAFSLPGSGSIYGAPSVYVKGLSVAGV